MELGTRLGQQQKPQLKLSPAQMQAMKILELSVQQLEDRVNTELNENEALEEDDEKSQDEYAEQDDDPGDDDFGRELGDTDWTQYLGDDDVPEYKTRSNNYSDDDDDHEYPISAQESFQDQLIGQWRIQSSNEREQQLGDYIIGNLDGSGYLSRSVEQMVDDLEFNLNIKSSDEEMLHVLSKIQQLDPPGIGARSLKECLLIQLRRKRATPGVLDAIRILDEEFEEFSYRHFDVISRRLMLTEEQMHAAMSEIEHLNPKPGNAYSDSIYDTSQGITPDVIVENIDGELIVSLNNSNIPQLHISRSYSDTLQDFMSNKANQTSQRKSEVTYIKQKIDSAKGFINAIAQRNETLLTTMRVIVRLQKDFFVEGDETALKPMVLKDVAERAHYDVSTISRVNNSKYVQTEFGIFPLKFFFSEGMENSEGDEVSTREIKKVLEDIIDNEDKAKPLADEKLVDEMEKRGYKIARRTIAKYRDLLGIPVARMRKQLVGASKK